MTVHLHRRLRLLGWDAPVCPRKHWGPNPVLTEDADQVTCQVCYERATDVVAVALGGSNYPEDPVLGEVFEDTYGLKWQYKGGGSWRRYHRPSKRGRGG